MKHKITLLAAGALMVTPSAGFAARPSSGSIQPHHSTGQQVPPLECDDGIAPASTTRHHAAGQGSPFQEESVSGSHYAGTQPGINDKNTASVSQYDIACFGGPDRPGS